MTSIEKARFIVKTGDCGSLSCNAVEPCPCHRPTRGKSECLHGKGSSVTYCKDWLAKNDPDQNEIIGWPGNAEEMKQYIGRQCICCDRYSFKGHSAQGKLAIKYDPDMPYTNEQCGDGFIFCKILPEPTVTEYTIQEIADKLGVPVESIRIKD